METPDLPENEAWAAKWIQSVADSSNTMSQRKLTSIQKHGGLETVKALAEQNGVHLLLVRDEDGSDLVAASPHPFTVLC